MMEQPVERNQSSTVRWGIVGTGMIAGNFAGDMRHVEGGTLAAVCSRSMATARQFADGHGSPQPFDNLAAMIESDAVDAIYLATPNTAHFDDALTVLAARKPLLIEKPLTATSAEAERLASEAREQKTFLMEAMWTRFLPASRLARELVADGAIGELCSVSAEFGINVPYDPGHRLFSADLGGGAMLDLGVYPLALASQYLGELTVVGATRQLSPDQMVDTQTTVLVRGENGVSATLGCASRTVLPNRAVLAGTAGWIEIPSFWAATEFVLHREGAEPERFHRPFRANGLEYEIEEVSRCLAAGERQSPDMTWAESQRLAGVMDQVRDAGGLVYSPANVKAVPLG